MILTYRIISNFLYPLLIAFTYLRKFFNKEHQERYKEKIFTSNFNIERKENDSFEMEIYKPIKSSEYKDKFEISKKLNEILEDMIKRNPSQWIWTHKRWKL